MGCCEPNINRGINRRRTCFFAVCHEQVRSSLRKLDEECYLKYGKSYSQSFHEIFKDKYN